MRAEEEKKRKEKEKGGKNGDQNLFFFISPCACFFICAVVIFQIYKGKKFPEMETALRHFKGSNSGPARPFNYSSTIIN